MAIRFEKRSAMSWRHVLRDIPRPLRRRWLAMRLQFDAPRVDISSAWLPQQVQRNVRY
ncbi:hypothetical protein OKW41_002100 [Paraburkholderia sp. UCT70]|uniref:hypothetical protein n=1 Tax=Paraburkholderia sp. UCT70 TaxID=2991068 RepID=UPI003D22FA52